MINRFTALSLLTACSILMHQPLNAGIDPHSGGQWKNGLLYPIKNEGTDTVDWTASVIALKKLEHKRKDRWPLTLFSSFDKSSLDTNTIKELLSRGIAPQIRLTDDAIELAERITKAGAPLIVMEGKDYKWPGNLWPYNLTGDKSKWAHEYPENMPVPDKWKELPVPTYLEGWNIAADQLRELLKKFKNKKLNIDAIWLDYEGEPSVNHYPATKNDLRSKASIPKRALASEPAFNSYRRQLWVSLMSSYIAGPAREFFPGISVTNWAYSLSSNEFPILNWSGRPNPPTGINLFTATNPIAYGIDIAVKPFLIRRGEYINQAEIDRYYTYLLLRQPSANQHNLQNTAPWLESIPWVARWVLAIPGKVDDTPIMTRQAYRESLRHLWLRGIDGMQVFNPEYGNYDDMAKYELEDSQAVYDEMLAHYDFLEKGTPMNIKLPHPEKPAVLWSGMVYRNEAIVRAIYLGNGKKDFTIEPWKGETIKLTADSKGKTHYLTHPRINPTLDTKAVLPDGSHRVRRYPHR